MALRAQGVLKDEGSGLIICAPATAATDKSQVWGLSLSKRPLIYLLSLSTLSGLRLIGSGLLCGLLEVTNDVRPVKLQ